MSRRLLALLLVALVSVALAACGGDETDSGAIQQAPAEDVGPAPESTVAKASGGEVEVPNATQTSKKPQIRVPAGDPPSTLQKKDLVTGDGRTAKKGDQVTVQYVGVSWSTGEQFDASWDNGKPFSFELGAGNVIQGWDQGVAGMKTGGRRQLVIPPDLAYGSQGQGTIGPNETLVFVVDLLKVA
jgi:peptidylprolyl isomerase